MDSSSSSDQMEEQEGRGKRVLKKKKRNREIERKEPLKGDGQLKAKQRCSPEFVGRRLSFKEHPEGRRAREKREVLEVPDSKSSVPCGCMVFHQS